ncbi:unnamed protein product, partial [marine sediment metagenome]
MDRYTHEIIPELTIKFFNDRVIPDSVFRLYFEDYKDVINQYGKINKVSLHYPISQFNNIISILQNKDKPNYIFIEVKDENPRGG